MQCAKVQNGQMPVILQQNGVAGPQELPVKIR